MRIDRTGLRYGRLVVLGRVGSYKNDFKWRCLCDCGNTTVALGCNLVKGNTKSCGCLHLEAITHHGGTKDSSLGYESWRMMRQRCLNPKYTQYKDYGGRGISICPEWDTFEKFTADMGPRPEGYTLERNNNDGNYELGNCRWATRQEQNKNKRPAKKVGHNASQT